jgi:hypothetical protein
MGMNEKIITDFPPPDFRGGTWKKDMDRNWADLQYQDEQAVKAKTHVGRFFTIPVADGKAVYIIVKENKKTFTIKLATGIGDGYQAPYLGAGRAVDRSFVLEQLRAKDGLARLFGGK